MRPLQLSFSGIRSYPGKVGPLDFTSKTLIAILGDTGAGKSTILEAITLALYGNCTWTEGEHKVLMAEGVSQMTVDLVFAHDGQRWRVRRAFHANTTPSGHLLQNLDTGEQIDNKRPVNKKIEALLQLDFDSFKAALLLPQGKFDRLLTAPGGERTDLLKGIFGVQAIEAMRDRASRHRDRLAELIHQADVARSRLPDDPLLLHRQQVGRPPEPNDWPGASARPLTPFGRSSSKPGAHATSTRGSSPQALSSITTRRRTSTAS